MRSYLLGIVVAILLSAVYAFSNTGEISVRFLSLEHDFPQGIWEIFLFAAGALIMWLFSVAASFELYAANRKKNREAAKRIAELEDEKKSLLTTLQHIGETAGFHSRIPENPQEPEPCKTEPCKKTPNGDKTPDEAVQAAAEPENKKNRGGAPSFLKNLYGSFFVGGDAAKTEESQSQTFPELAGGGETFAPDTGANLETTETSGDGAPQNGEDDEKKETFTV
ncbi:MAG: LapA family protein [Synergistaceae bacterium]|nr:LapA family protein [Synergistaceae bacterium]